MPAVAEVQFKATGSQQVVTGFKSIGDSASTATTKVQQNSTALKSMGQGMKTSVSGIGQVTTAFATLSLSIVSTWRAYRDLGDAQIAVDKANLRVKKTTEAIRKTEAEIAAIKKEGARGGLEDQRRKIDLTKLTDALTAAQKKYGKNSIQAADAALKLKEAQAQGTGSSKKLTDAENKLALQKEQLGVQTDVASEAQERFNDIQQDFYLSIIPTALSSLGLLTTAFKGLGSSLKFGLGPIGLILGGISLAIIAFQTNFLGLKDAVGGVIDWIKERFGLWKDTIEKVFNLIRSGDWSGAFNLIKEAAAKFWEDLKKSNPFFGGVATLIEQFRKGDWQGAFNTIRTAAVFFWTELKKAIPLFGTIETIVKQISQGKWLDAFNTIKDAAVQFWIDLVSKVPFLGDLATYLRTKLELATATAKAEFNLMKDSLTKKGGPIDLIQQGLAKLGSGDVVGGFSQIWTGIDKAIGIAITRINDWVKLNFGIDIVNLANQALSIGATILGKIGEGMTAVANAIDPFVALLFNVNTWTTALNAVVSSISAIGTTIFNFLAGAISTAASDPAATGTWWTDVGTAIWSGIVTWMEANLPDTTKAMRTFAQGFVDAVDSTQTYFKISGMKVWNSFIEGIKSGLVFAATDINPFTNALFKILGVSSDEIKNSPKFKEMWTFDVNAELNKASIQDVRKQIEAENKVPPQIKIDGNTKLADQKLKAQLNKINSSKATIHIAAEFTRNLVAQTNRIPAGTFHQHGYQSTVHRPTMFIAGEGGRPEDVTVRPRGSVQRGGSGGGGFNGTINVYVDGVLRPARYDMGARK